MNTLTRALVEAMKAVFDPPGPVLEIGSRQVQGEGLGDLRSLFEESEYIGCDAEPGSGVDRVERIEALSFADGSAGTVLCLNVLEHVWDVKKGVDEIHRVTAPGGAALVVTAFDFHVHGYPEDYWRFTPRALERLFEKFENVFVGWQGIESHPRAVFVLGLKRKPEEAARLAEAWRTGTLARWDDGPTTSDRLRAAVGAMFFGKSQSRRVRYYRNLTIRLVGCN